MGYSVSGIASSYDEAVRMLASEAPDLVLLDIMIKGSKSGIDVGHYIQENLKVPFIYLSSLSDKKTIEQAKETHPNAYLLKPFRAENLFASIEIAIENAASPEISQPAREEHSCNLVVKDSLFIKKDNLFHKVKIKDILFIKAEGNYLEINVNTGAKHIIRSTIKSFLEFLGEFPFFQTHKSYVINLDYIDTVSYTFVKIQKHEVPLSQSKKDELLALMNSFS
jgi:DNA-binding LytR/AlgR family response regulator